MKKTLMTTFLMIFLSQAPVVGDTIVTDRPDFTESAQTVTPGKIQTEAGYTFANWDGEQEHTVGELLIRIPLTSKFEGRVAVNSLAFTTTHGAKTAGLQDSSLGFKLSLNPEQKKWIPQMALIAAATLPSGGNAYRENTLQPGAKLCLGWALSEKWSFSSNLNYDHASEEGATFDKFTQSTSFGWAFKENWGAYFEAFRVQPNSTEGLETSYINGGVTYLVSDDIQLDARAGKGLNGISSEHFIGIGISNRIKI